MDFEPDYITQTQHGREKVIFRGYAYVKDKNGPNDVSYWRCERKDELFCKGRARMCSGKIKALVGDHNHAPEVERKEVATVRDCIAVHSQETVESTSQIVTSVLAQASFAAVVQLPHTKSLKRQSQRDRIRVQNVPPNPGTLQDLQLPDNYKNTIDGDLFLLYDSGPAAAENRMILFCTEVNLNLLDDSEHWYTDGTFKTVPRLFLQLYTIAVKVNGYYLPLVYALLPNKMQQTYERLLDILIQAKAGIKPESVTMDFEKGAMNAVQVKFPGCEVHGCYFHLSQNIFRHVQTAGLQERYTADAQFQGKSDSLRLLLSCHSAMFRSSSITWMQHCPKTWTLSWSTSKRITLASSVRMVIAERHCSHQQLGTYTRERSRMTTGQTIARKVGTASFHLQLLATTQLFGSYLMDFLRSRQSWSGAGRERLPVMRLRRREGSMKIETSASVQYSDLSRTGQRTNSCEELLQIWHSISWYD